MMEQVIENIVRNNPEYGIKKIKSILNASYPEATTKQVRAIVDKCKSQVEFTEMNNKLAETSISCSSDLTLNFHTTLVQLLNSPFRKNLQAIIHVIGGLFGEYSPNKESILQLAKHHPLFGKGNSKNTPLHSCKLATTLLRILSCELDVDSLQKSANCLARSAGAFFGMEHESPNAGLLSAEIKLVSQSPPALFLISVALSDLFAFRFPFSDKSFAHSFSILVFHRDAKLYGRIYQAFGPPNIGYSLNDCVTRGSGSKLLLERDILDFVDRYEKFESFSEWNSEVQTHYRRLFSCNLSLPMQYPILCYTKVHRSKVDIETVSQIACFFTQ